MAHSITFHRYRHWPASESSIRWKPKVEKLSKTGSTNKLATATVCLGKLLLLPVWVYLYLQIALRSRWYRFPSQSCNCFRYLCVIVECLDEGSKEASCQVNVYTSEKLAPLPLIKVGTASVIASIFVSVAKVLVLPVSGTVSTSGLYLMVFCIVGRCRRKWRWIGFVRKLCP